MGIRLFARSSSSYDGGVNDGKRSLPNPDPKNYKIKGHIREGKYLLLHIEYPDCANFEGVKILIYENTTIDELKKQGSIDPHFSENKNFKSPIARFEPTPNGFSNAMRFIEMMNGN